MNESKQKIAGRKYVKNHDGNMLLEESKIMDCLKDYFEKLLNEENQFDMDARQKISENKRDVK